MSNILYDDKFFNEEIKQEYLDELSKGNQKIMSRIFKISYQMESDLSKDLYDFSREELRRLFYLFMASTPNASKGNVLYVQAYIDWAIENEYTTGINVLDTVSVEWKESFVVRPEKTFLTDTEIKDIMKKLVNAQDALVLYAPFIGILGNENAEIINLKEKHLDAESLIAKVIDADNSVREVKVDEEFVRLVRQANNQDQYIKSNGNPDDDVRSAAAELVDNSFTIRSAKTRLKNTEEADKHILYRRYAMIKKQFDLPNLTPTLVFHSGMLYLAKKLLDEGTLNDDGYKQIATQFNISDAVLRRLRDDFLNEDGIKTIYQS